jgi:hypothetical protein
MDLLEKRMKNKIKVVGPSNACMLYKNNIKEQIKKEFKNITPKELNQKQNEMWKKLDESEKKRWERAAEKDKSRLLILNTVKGVAYIFLKNVFFFIDMKEKLQCKKI